MNFDSIFDYRKSLNSDLSEKDYQEPSAVEQLLAKTILAGAYATVALTFPISLPFCLKKVNENETVVASTLGVDYHQKSEKGWYFSIPYLQTFEKFKHDPVEFSIDIDQVLTKDLFELKVGLKLAYKINDPLKLKNSSSNINIVSTTRSALTKTINSNNYSVIQDQSVVRSEVLMTVNSFAMSNWGIQLCSDHFKFEHTVTKRGQEGPGDPGEQVIKLIKDYFLPESAEPNPIPEIENLEITESSPLKSDHQEKSQPKVPLTLSKFLNLKNCTAELADEEFKSLAGKIYRITVTDYDYVVIVNGKDRSQPIQPNGTVEGFESVVDIFLASSDIEKLLKSEYSAMKTYIGGSIRFEGSHDVKDLINLAKFVKALLKFV